MRQTAPSIEVSNHLERALQLLEEKKDAELSEFLDDLHPVELVSVITSVEPEQQSQLFTHVTGLDQLAGLISYAGEPLREQVLEVLDDSRVAAVVRRLEVDEAADVVGSLPRRKQISVLRRVSPVTAKEITILLAYDQETAGGLMTTLFLSFPESRTAEQALNELRNALHLEEIDPDIDISYIYILDNHQHLKGVSSLRELLTAEPETPLKDLMATDVVTVSPEDDQEKVARIIADYDFTSVPVVSPENDCMLGIVTVDDVLDVIEEEYTEDLLKLAGTVDEDIVGATIPVALRSRLPWLIASWFGGICGAVLLGTYSSTLEQVVALAFFMPVVFGMAGNVGSQSSTITVCGIARGELGEYRISGRLRKEALTGLLLGIFFGVLLSSAAYVLYRDLRLGLIVGASIMVTMTCAASFGSMLPLIIKRFGFDPAVASGPFVTTATDILSITIYFAIATGFLTLM